MLRNKEVKGHTGLTPVILSTAASLSVCMLLVAFASDNQPSVMMNWGQLEDSQLMNGYKKAVTAGDSQFSHVLNSASHQHTLDLDEPGRHPGSESNSAHQKRSSMSEAVQELKHLREVSASVWPSESKHARQTPQTSAQLLAHYKLISSESLPKSTAHTRKAMSAAQELAGFKKLSDEVFPSESESKHSSWHHQTSGDMLAHYKQMSANAMPHATSKARKPAQTAQQELAHLKRLSARVLPAHSQISRAKAVRRPAAVPLPVPRRPAVAPHRIATLAEAEPRTRTIAGGLEITDVKLGTGAEPQVGDNIKASPPPTPLPRTGRGRGKIGRARRSRASSRAIRGRTIARARTGRPVWARARALRRWPHGGRRRAAAGRVHGEAGRRHGVRQGRHLLPLRQGPGPGPARDAPGPTARGARPRPAARARTRCCAGRGRRRRGSPDPAAAAAAAGR
jgi:hypothetical protein